VHVPADAWDFTKVPAHLQPTFRILDESGEVLGEGKDLEVLKAPLRASFEAAVADAAAEAGLESTGQRSWTFGEVPGSFRQLRAGHDVLGFPGLVDEGGTVGLRVFGTETERDAQHLRGVRRLLALSVDVAKVAAGLGEGLDNPTKLTLAAAPYPNVKALLADCVLAALGDLATPVRDQEAFTALANRASAELPERALAVRHQVVRVLEGVRATDRALHGSVEMTVLPSMNDMRQHLGRLVGPGFVAEAGAEMLREYPRYLAALAERRRRLEESPARDREAMQRVQPFQDAVDHRFAALPAGSPPPAGLVALRWLVEEFRVSLWAQHLGTKQPVSENRLRQALERA
jgi:ATP-dependent helicase HrpA